MNIYRIEDPPNKNEKLENTNERANGDNKIGIKQIFCENKEEVPE